MNRQWKESMNSKMVDLKLLRLRSKKKKIIKKNEKSLGIYGSPTSKPIYTL